MMRIKEKIILLVLAVLGFFAFSYCYVTYSFNACAETIEIPKEYSAATFDELQTYIEEDGYGIVRSIKIAGDFEITDSLLLAHDTEITLWADKDVTLTLSTVNRSNGAMFVIEGNSGVTFNIGKPDRTDGGRITFDGNKESFRRANIKRKEAAIIRNSQDSTEDTRVHINIYKATVENCCATECNGNAFRLFNYTKLTVYDMIFRNNETTGTSNNGSIYCAEAVVYGGEYYHNVHSGSSAPVYYIKTGNATYKTSITIYGGSFHDNYAANTSKGKGGAVTVGANSCTYIYGGTFTDNGALTGGAVYTQSETVCIDGTPRDESGNICEGDAVNRINDALVFSGNTANEGGAIYIAGSSQSAANVKLAEFVATSNAKEDVCITDNKTVTAFMDHLTVDRLKWTFGQNESSLTLCSDFVKEVLLHVDAREGEVLAHFIVGSEVKSLENIRLCLTGVYPSPGVAYGLTSEGLVKQVSLSSSESTYEIEIASSTNGSASAGGSARFGETVIISVAPDADYVVKEVLLDGVAIKAQRGQYLFIMPARKVSVTANFALRPHAVTAVYDSSQGTVTVDSSAGVGETVAVFVTAASGYTVERVECNGQELKYKSATGGYEFVMTEEDAIVTVTFANLYSLHYTCEGSGSVAASVKEAKAGEKIALSFTAESGYAPSKVMINGKEIFADAYGTYSFDMPTSDAYVYVEFAYGHATITYIVAEGEILTSEVLYGTAFVSRRVSKEGYAFMGWYFDEDFEIPVSTAKVMQDITVYAKWEKIETEIDSSDGGNGCGSILAASENRAVSGTILVLLVCLYKVCKKGNRRVIGNAANKNR